MIIFPDTPVSIMDGNKRPMGMLYLVVPGLGQVYCGELLCGTLVFLVTYLALFTWILGSLSLLGFLGFGFMNDYLLLPLLLGLGAWAWGAWDACTCNRKMVAGEIPWQEPCGLHLVLFIAGAVFLLLAGLAVTGTLYFMFGLSAMAATYSHESRPLNITLTAEKTGGVITIQNRGNETSPFNEFIVLFNDQPLNRTYDAEPGGQFTINSTNATDRVTVYMINPVGIRSTLLNTSV